MALTPDFATHYYLSDRDPFLNLTELPDVELASVLLDLDAKAAAGLSQRRFGSRYMDLRRSTERRLRALFVERGGRPERLSPHYFVLGLSEWFRGLYGENAAEFRLPLGALPFEATSLTYPDSVVAMGLLPEFGITVQPQPYHGQLYRLDELDGLIDHYGLPAQPDQAVYDGYQRRAGEHFIEIQLWSDAPLGISEQNYGIGRS